MNKTILTLSLILVAIFGTAVARCRSVTGAIDTDELAVREVREVLMKSASSFEKNDLVTATRVWANDESLTVFEQGHANYGWADYRDNHLAPEMREMKNTKYVLSDLRVHVAGKTAWATFKYTIAADVVDNGKQRHVDGTGLGTAILEKRNGRWQIVHWHSSAPRRSPPSVSGSTKN